MVRLASSLLPAWRRHGLAAAVALLSSALAAPWLVGCAARSTRIPRLEPPPAGVRLEPAPPAHVMWMRVVAARVPESDRSGRPFDDDGLPDPLVVVSSEGQELLRTSTVEDTLTPLWPDGTGANFSLPAGSTILVQVFDADGLSEQPIQTASLAAPKLEDVERGAVELAVGPATVVRLLLEPAHPRYGLGFAYQLRSGQCFVSSRFEHGPAGRAGMRVGDRIVNIDGAPVAGMSPAELRSQLGSVASAGLELQVLHSSGTSETVRLVEGPIYVLDAERGLME